MYIIRLTGRGFLLPMYVHTCFVWPILVLKFAIYIHYQKTFKIRAAYFKTSCDNPEQAFSPNYMACRNLNFKNSRVGFRKSCPSVAGLRPIVASKRAYYRFWRSHMVFTS